MDIQLADEGRKRRTTHGYLNGSDAEVAHIASACIHSISSVLQGGWEVESSYVHKRKRLWVWLYTCLLIPKHEVICRDRLDSVLSTMAATTKNRLVTASPSSSALVGQNLPLLCCALSYHLLLCPVREQLLTTSAGEQTDIKENKAALVPIKPSWQGPFLIPQVPIPSVSWKWSL